METDYQKMLDNLTILLQDICQFLSSDKLGFLSHRDRKLMESLINRSKVQLQEIAKVEAAEKACEEYVDMDAKNVLVLEEEEEKLDIYSSVDDVNKTGETITQEDILSHYMDLPAKEASQHIKHGYISMRRRFLLGFEKMKRVYGTIHNQWLLIYCTEKDTKPMCTFNLKDYEAKEVDGPKSSNFELISTSSERKIYYFMALTPKDMLQWVANINRCHDNVIVQSKGLDFDENIELENEPEQHYDAIMPCVDQQNDEIAEEEDIYIELNDIDRPQNNNTITQKQPESHSTFCPPLPGRRPGSLPAIPPVVKPPTPLQDSQESLASYDDITELQKPSEPSMDEAFSDDDNDDTYEEFVHVKQNIIKRSNPMPSEDTARAKNDTDEVLDSKNEAVAVSIKDRIEKYRFTNATSDAVRRDVRNEVRNRSFVHSVATRMSNPPPTPPASEDVKSEVDEMKNTSCSSSNPPSPDSQNVKKFSGLTPPVLPKVPIVPLKPKVRDRQPCINRSGFATIRPTASDR